MQRSLDLRDAAAGGLLGLPAAGGGGREAPPGHRGRGRGGHRGPDGGHGAGAAHSPLQSTHKSSLEFTNLDFHNKVSPQNFH